ncbi:MAG TPA: DUF3040 domain-containing protein [Nakamurella sp.]
MSLSEDEKFRLGEIEAHVRATDPRFVRRLSIADLRRRQRRFIVTLWCLLFLGISMFANGLTAAKGLISLGMLTAVFGGALTAWSIVMVVRFKAWRTQPH